MRLFVFWRCWAWSRTAIPRARRRHLPTRVPRPRRALLPATLPAVSITLSALRRGAAPPTKAQKPQKKQINLGHLLQRNDQELSLKEKAQPAPFTCAPRRGWSRTHPCATCGSCLQTSSTHRQRRMPGRPTMPTWRRRRGGRAYRRSFHRRPPGRSRRGRRLEESAWARWPPPCKLSTASSSCPKVALASPRPQPQKPRAISTRAPSEVAHALHRCSGLAG